MISNAPFVNQQIYPLVTGDSNSPFTDQRAVSAGGGTGGSNGNVVLSADDGIGLLSVNNADGTQSQPILQIIQAGNPLTIAANDLSLEASQGALLIKAQNDDVSIEAPNNSIGLTASDLSIESTVGEITLDATQSNISLEAFDNIDLETTTGDIDLEAFDNIALEATTGNISISAESAGKTVTLKTKTVAGTNEREFGEVQLVGIQGLPNCVTFNGRNICYYQFANGPGSDELTPGYRFCDTTKVPQSVIGNNEVWSFPDHPETGGQYLAWSGFGVGNSVDPKRMTWVNPPPQGAAAM